MIKLYNKVNGVLNYWETWDKNDKIGIIHWGEVGEKGTSKEVTSGLFRSFRKEIQKQVTEKINEGFSEIVEDDLYTLLIEFKVDEQGTPEDVEKRTRLQNRMDGTLGWTGLGHCDGGSIGSGTMEVCCLVVDPELAKKRIQEDLKNTEFDNYTRIFDEN
ncbi:hypothetical protein ABIB62_000559 [Mucilaginibacter sp. UYP25]|uniref:hypothetical protein n=1 Tax=unclassified Mucilaginibacter TaxID=2617802 RepID=UPI00339AD081